MATLVGSLSGIVQDARCRRCAGQVTLEQEDYEWVTKCMACGAVYSTLLRSQVKAYHYRQTILVGGIDEILNYIRGNGCARHGTPAPPARLATNRANSSTNVL